VKVRRAAATAATAAAGSDTGINAGALATPVTVISERLGSNAFERSARSETVTDAKLVARRSCPNNTEGAAQGLDLDYLFQRISADDSAATRLFNGVEKAIYTLEQLPRRCPVAPESKRAKRRLRQLLYGAKRDVYRVIYEIDESSKVVRVLTIRLEAMDKFISGV
jgi:toxin ParE1/3/4